MRQLVALVAVAVYAWWAVGLTPYTTGSAVAVVGAGVTAMVARRQPQRPPPPPPPPPEPKRGTGAWLALAGVTAAWQLASFVQSPRDDHPTISSITNGLLDDHPTRAAAFTLWLLAARSLARR